MMDADGIETEEFDQAAQYVRTLGSLPVEKMLEFYGYFKQAREGPCSAPKPGFFDFEGKKKWQAWKDVGDISREEAKARYVEILDELDADWRDKVDQSGGGGNGATAAAKPKGGFGVAVSSMQQPEEDQIDPKDKTLFDFVREGDLDQVRRLLARSASQRRAGGGGGGSSSDPKDLLFAS